MSRRFRMSFEIHKARRGRTVTLYVTRHCSRGSSQLRTICVVPNERAVGIPWFAGTMASTSAGDGASDVLGFKPTALIDEVFNIVRFSARAPSRLAKPCVRSSSLLPRP